MSDVTIGEALSRRRLQTEAYGSRTIYSQGQDYAVRLGPDDCLLSWVDAVGGLCIVPCEKVNDEWFHRGNLLYCTVDSMEARLFQRSAPLTSRMILAIETAMQRKVTRRPVGKPDDGS